MWGSRRTSSVEGITHAFCEPSNATPTSRVHIREVSDSRLYPGGGIPSQPLCGFDLRHGWDLPGVVTLEKVAAGIGAETGPTCRACATAYGWVDPALCPQHPEQGHTPETCPYGHPTLD